MHPQKTTRPHVYIPPGAQQPTNPSPSAYAFELTPPSHLANPWDGLQLPSSSPFNAERARALSMVDQRSSSPSRARTIAGGQSPPHITFPEPQIYRSSSHRASLQPSLTPPFTHRPSRSDDGGHATENRLHWNASSHSVASSYYQPDDSDHYASSSADSHGEDAMSRELSSLSLQSEEGIEQFQAGKLPESEQEWHRLVPPEAREALGKQEVQRQSVLFEVCKSEREYVADLEAIQQVYIIPLQTASPPIIRGNLAGFITEVFGNLHEILGHHQRILAALFARQREQHPFVISVSDIILDTTLKAEFRAAYETYIKHYPIAESHHRKELRRNGAYQNFILSVSSDPRIRKRDLITFLSRPVTRLPRLNLLLQQILKLTDTDSDHSDLESLPVVLDILKDTVRSTQPGIEAAESKVKFWALCENLVYQKGEIIDMDLYDDSRTLVHAGPVARRIRSSTSGTSWNDLTLALLDNFALMTREETKANGTVKRYLMSRPLPLSFLRLGSFNASPDFRKEYDKDGSVLGLRYHNVPVYPFTIYHASNKANRRYTLYVTTEAIRNKWHSALLDAIAVHKARQDGNMFFDPRILSDGFYRTVGPRTTLTSQTVITGKISCAVPFTSESRQWVAVGCTSGIYVAQRDSQAFKKVLNYSNPTTMAAVHKYRDKVFNKFIVHHESALYSYSLDLVALASQGEVELKALNESMEKLSGHPNKVVFFQHAHVGPRVLLIYAYKKMLQVSLSLQVLEVVDVSEAAMTPKRGHKLAHLPAFRPFGEPGYVPKDAFDVTTMVKTIGICTEDGIVVVDPTNLAKSATNIVPDLSQASINLPMSTLKNKLEGCKPLGLVRLEGGDELLAVYDAIGYYIDRHGKPIRSSGYIKWESIATSYAHRGNHVLLFSDEFIEIRQVTTGRLVQVVEGQSIRLLYKGPTASSDDPVLLAMKGGKDDQSGVSDRLCEMVETSEITTAHPNTPNAPGIWDEWDM